MAGFVQQSTSMTSTATLNDPMVKRLQAVQTQIDAGNLRGAAENLNAARDAAPGDPRVFLVGMLLAEAAGNPEGAQQSGRRALELAPDWPVAVTEVALLLARQNQFPEAISLATRAVDLDGDNPDVLGRVIDIAHRAQHMDLAIQWLERAVALKPEHLHIRYLLARDLAQLGQHERALEGLDVLIQAKPNDPILLLGRLKSRLALGDKELARADGQELVDLDPANSEYQFWSNLSQDKIPERYPSSMIREMYDGFAEVFDQHLVSGLKYSLPVEVAARIRQLYPDNRLNMLDLGCGTGLLGQQLGRIDGALVGVELSSKMIEKAARHGVYDRFHNVDLNEALEETPDSLWDLITALDVFIYVGELSAAIRNAFRVLRPGGHFIFSCETAQEGEADMVLRPTQRYAHKASYIEAMCRAAGFAEVTLDPMPLRYEKTVQVQGFLVTARKPA